MTSSRTGAKTPTDRNASVGRRRALTAGAASLGSVLLPAPAVAAARTSSGRALTGTELAPLSETGAQQSTVSGAAVSQRRIPSAANRHLLARFSYGLSAGMARRVRRNGGASVWFEGQLSPQQIADSYGTAIDSWFPNLWLTPAQQWKKFETRTITVTSSAEELASWALLRRIHSRRQVHEVMTEFWSNMLHVPSPLDKAWPHRPGYDAAIRRHALGRFDQLLDAAITHPAMLLYLDNYESTYQAPNENLGRELLELHTVGRESGFSESDVWNSSMILTGWAVDRDRHTWEPFYNFDGHYRGPVKVMGFSHPNGAADGRQLTRDYLNWLAHHPATALRIAHRLAVRFVSDVPSKALVEELAGVFTKSGTDIKTTLLSLIRHPEFLASAGHKVRTPTEDFVATCRALRLKIQAPRPNSDDFANLCIWQVTGMGQRPFDWPTPDGFPDAGAVWASTTRMLGSWTVHNNLAAQVRPATGVDYRDLQHWLPPLPARFDYVVDHASRKLLQQSATASLTAAASRAVGITPETTITADHPVVTLRLPMLIACLLDSPLHMTR